MTQKNDNNKHNKAKKGKKSPAQIFIVDDDRLVLATLKQGLLEKGYAVQDFSSPKKALSAYQDSPPDLALLDIQMPEMSGTDLAKQMLAISFRPIVMLSAYDDRDTVRQNVQLGVSGYLVKPVMPYQLVPSIESALARFDEISALLKNSDNLREGLEKNRVISTAVGITMERRRINADMAFQQLRTVTRDQRKPLLEIAADLIDAITFANGLTGTTSPDIDND